jgi:hypothetical protein
VSVDVSDLKSFIEERTMLAGDNAGDQIRSTVEAAEPQSKTGELASSEEYQVVAHGPELWQASFAFTSDHASYTDTGSEPHEIPAPLSFFYEAIGEQVNMGTEIVKVGDQFYKTKGYVAHPGSPGTRWFSDNTDEASWMLAVEEALDSVL